MTGQLAKDIWDRTTQTAQPGQVSLETLALHVSLRGQPGWVSLDRTERIGLPGLDSRIERAVDKGVRVEKLQDRTAGTGQQRQDSRDGTAKTGQPGRIAGIRQLRQDSQDKTAGTGQPGQES